jgi:hypothetical protein
MENDNALGTYHNFEWSTAPSQGPSRLPRTNPVLPRIASGQLPDSRPTGHDCAGPLLLYVAFGESGTE